MRGTGADSGVARRTANAGSGSGRILVAVPSRGLLVVSGTYSLERSST